MSMTKKINLVLDLDETFIKCLKQKVDSPLFRGSFILGDEHFIYIREGVESFIDEMSDIYNLYVYSNGTKKYVDNVCRMFHNNKKFSGVYSRDYSDNYVKSLERIGLKKENTLILDDRMDVWNPSCHSSLIPILPFTYQYGRFFHVYELKYIKYKIHDIYHRYIINYKVDGQNDISNYT